MTAVCDRGLGPQFHPRGVDTPEKETLVPIYRAWPKHRLRNHFPSVGFRSELSFLLYTVDGSRFCPHQNFLTLNLTPPPSPFPLGSGGIPHKVDAFFCRVKSAHVQQTVSHIPCKSKFFCMVALLKMGVCPNCSVLIGRRGDRRAETLEAVGEAKRGGCLERRRGPCAPPPRRRRANELAGPRHPRLLQSPRDRTDYCKEWAG